ncbi:MAG TPA: hypothetical protein V6C91_19190 [Coleofasciculaceae cyanobacterium]
MLKFLRFSAAVSVVLVASISACSSREQSQQASSASQPQGSSTALAQADSSAVTPEMALASHLSQLGAKVYGAHWCPYCNKQKELFGKAFTKIDYVECDPAGKDARPELCRKANVDGFPTWEIQGKYYPGMKSLQELADLSGYKGDRNFKD